MIATIDGVRPVEEGWEVEYHTPANPRRRRLIIDALPEGHYRLATGRTVCLIWRDGRLAEVTVAGARAQLLDDSSYYSVRML